MTSSICGWLVVLLVISFSAECCNSQQQELQLLQPYHQLHHLHAGVVRDFESLTLKQERQETQDAFNSVGNINSGKIRRRSETDAVETKENPADRMLQNEIAFCYDALYLADLNQDDKVDAEEFVTFAQIMGPSGFLPNSDTYQELPLILQSNFIILACLCLQIPNFNGGTGIDPQCCAVDPHIDISGTQPGEIPNSRQSQYLYQVCFLTETSIDRLLLSATPTPEPSNPPPVVSTDKPTGKPTKQPTDKPSPDPTTKPTISPTSTMTTEPTTKPTVEPTTALTVQPTGQPTDQPTAALTEQPTDQPTLAPSAKPSANPTLKPTEPVTTANPSAKPTTGSPTMAPTTQRPSPTPSLEGDNVSSFPVESPSAVPTVSPVPLTEVAIVNYGIAITNGKIKNIPTSSYISDLIKSMDIIAEEVAYSMNLGEGESRSRGLREEQQRGGVMRGSYRVNQRKLVTAITVNIPTDIERFAEAECPYFVPSNDDCQTVTASAVLNIDFDGDSIAAGRQGGVQALADPTIVKDLFQENLNTSIESGSLQAALIEVNPNSVVTITTGFVPPPPTPSPTSPTTETPTLEPTNEPLPISSGGIAGIVLAGVGGLIIGFIIIAALRRRGLEAGGANLTDQFSQGAEETRLKDNEKLGGDDSSPERVAYDVPTSLAGAGVAATTAVETTAALRSSADDSQPKLSASTGSPSKKKRPSDNLYEVPGAKPTVVDDASSAGESGWSSNQDGSSANTSMDNSLDSIPQSNFSGIVLGGGARNEAVGEPSSPLASPTRSQSLEQEQSSPTSGGSPHSQSLSQEPSYSGTTGTDGSIQSTYSELDEAIQKGDWAAVGVTAALLASQAYVDDNTQGSSKQSTSRLKRQTADLNPERAAELDRLVELGDWEGVVAAAAKFDAQEALRGDTHSSANSESGSAVDSTGGGSNTDSAVSGSAGGSSTGTAPSNMSGSQTIDTTTSPSTYTATGLTSETASTRSRARKLNEIRDEVEALVTAVVPEEADNVDEMMTQFRGREEELVETLRSMQERQVAQKARKESQKQAKRQAKEYMQDKKKQEFEAVDNTGNTADDIWLKEIEDFDGSIKDKKEIETEAMKDQLKEAINNENWENVAEAAAGLSGHTYSKGQTSSKDTESEVSNRSVDINALVDEGDWDGVVAAASRYAEGSTNASSSNDYTQEDTEDLADDSTIEQRRKRREERLREEEEALAQAEIWDAIADQTKVDDSQGGKGGPGNAGAAKMAADWAIDQSLAALKKAEEENDNDSQDSGQDKKGDNESL
jgi:hypothetical protein